MIKPVPCAPKTLHCGDIFRNHWAGELNPCRVFMFLKNKGETSIVASFDETKNEIFTSEYYTRDLKNDEHFEAIGHFPIKDVIKNELMKYVRRSADDHK